MYSGKVRRCENTWSHVNKGPVWPLPQIFPVEICIKSQSVSSGASIDTFGTMKSKYLQSIS